MLFRSIDFKKNSIGAMQYSVFDAVTGEDIGEKLAIFYADDEKGIIRYYLEDDHGNFYEVPGNPDKFAWDEQERKIVIKRV